jgi:hypothetical protein
VKGKRGRPVGKKFPEPHTLDQGFDIATFGKIGASQGMAFVRDCPCATIDWIRKKVPGKRSRAEKLFLKRGPDVIEKWAIRIGPYLCEKIAAGDSKFFREVAHALEERREGRTIEDFRRYLAMQYRFNCHYIDNKLFTSKGLLAYYRRHNHKIDSSTLSKIMRWVLSAELLSPARAARKFDFNAVD